MHQPNRTGSFNYLAPSVEPSLYRNGRVLTRRDRDGSDHATVGVVTERVSVPVHDARQESCTLQRNGFERHSRPLRDPHLDFMQNEAVVRRYYAECADRA